MFYNSGGPTWQTIVVGQVILQKTVKEHQKQDVKVASKAGGTSKTILNAHPKLAKKGAKIAMAATKAVKLQPSEVWVS
ncbi:D-arabinose 5-phosphate isomerase GutQ [Leclercia sp. 1548]|jgi:D-arabinose 5-phosphate isomerase GutQ|nr:hypothetical protein APT61_14425 [Leclercia adecarboxylata]KFC90467.1 hypothetical protein GLAD_03978 [Leclercia adecarboxylata ATCC 23216 = NBRC 102595]SPX65385.1 Uncharacterised protein [Leclercia adecarboxylata]STX26426.1 Uncharacterised protein [Leclercia adecarboxylata]